MATQLASTTILHGASKQDIAVPVGTTVARVMSMLRIDADPETLCLTHPDGTPVDLDLALGSDLTSGTVLTLTGPAESERVAHQVAVRASSPWFRPTLVLSLFLTLVTGIETACLAGPVLGWWPVSDVLRGSAAVACTVALGWSLKWRRMRCTAPGLLVATALIGVCGTALLPTDVGSLPRLALAATAWTALVAALVVWLVDNRSALSSTMAALWGLAGVLTCLFAVTDAPVTAISALVLAVATMTVTVIPTFAFRIPETQLLDLPTVTTSAPTVRTPEVAAPAPITANRVLRSIREGNARGQLLLIACCGTAGICAFPAAGLMRSDQPATGIAGGVMMLSAFLALALAPRARRDRPGRILPRIAALAIVAATLSAFGLSQPLGSQVMALLMIIAAASLSIITTSFAKGTESARLGRAGDITQTLSLILLPPAAAYAAGLFDLVRQIAS